VVHSAYIHAYLGEESEVQKPEPAAFVHTSTYNPNRHQTSAASPAKPAGLFGT